MQSRTRGAAAAALRRCAMLGGAALLVSAGACGDDDSPGGTGGTGAAGDIGVTSVEPGAKGGDVNFPVDATPSPDGSEIYFISYPTRSDEDGIGQIRLPAIFKSPASGGGAPTKLHEGAPLGAPFGITISDDGTTLFIADSSASNAGDEKAGGRIFSMPAGGGAPSPIAGTEGYNPGGVEHLAGVTYFTGRKDGKAGAYKIAGGAVSPVAEGAPFVDPSGIAVAKNGDVFVVDSGDAYAGQALASVVRIGAGGTTEVVTDGLRVGHPAGIALVPNETAVLVSALDRGKGTDVVYRLELGAKTLTSFSDIIGDFYESAGLHRARAAGVFAWADSHANGTGTVYVLKM
jgi:hypothetical protein